MKKLVILMLVMAVGGLAGVAIYERILAEKPAATALNVYCAASARAPVEAAAKQFQKETGVEIRIQSAGTGTLLSSIRVSQQGDVLIAADDGAVSDAWNYNLLLEAIPVATQRPVVAVRSGNPRKVEQIEDLLRPEIKVALANPTTSSISRVARGMLGSKWAAMSAHAKMEPSVTEVAADVDSGTADAGIVWNTTTAQFKSLAAVEMPEVSSREEHVSACVLASSLRPDSAHDFAHYLAAPGKGGSIFKASGFTPAAP